MSDIEKRAKELLSAYGDPSRLSDYGYDQDDEIYFTGEVLQLLMTALTIPEGYVLVPESPTSKMLEAGRGAHRYACVTDSITERENLMLRSRWTAMIAARPAPSGEAS